MTDRDQSFPPPRGEGGARRGSGRGPIRRARALRKTLTPQEAKLWLHLRALKGQGFHFRRQVPLFGYYPDFLCFTHRLIVEVDGGQHADGAQLESDSRRDGVFAQAGFLTHRVWNHEVNEDVGEVVEGIVLMLRARPPTRPLRVHPPHEGEGG